MGHCVGSCIGSDPEWDTVVNLVGLCVESCIRLDLEWDLVVNLVRHCVVGSCIGSDLE